MGQVVDPHDEYLGDHVYASFDGRQLWLTLNQHNIALEPAVLLALVQYAQRINRALGRRHFNV